MATNKKEYSRQYYRAHREQIKEYQRNYHRMRKSTKKMDVVLDNTAFNLTFQSSLKRIEDMYNDLLKKYKDLLEAYNNMKISMNQKNEELAELKGEIREADERKGKIKKFFNL